MRIKNLKKINKKALILTGVASAFAVSIFLPTFSWFKADTASPISVDGNIHGSYFESGDGTAANPFEIARPIQLYYLSWLQEMGYFNEAVLDENTGEYVLKQQYHFYLSKDIYMDINDEQYTIPPIGTIKYPFVGSFDGKGHVITDLVISNDYSEYTKDPRHPAGSNTHSDSYEILGLFGVLGTTESSNIVTSSIINQDGTIQQLQDNGDDVLVEFSEAGNYVQNVYLNNVTIVASTDSQHALAGAVAGYSNATVSHVGIFGATLRFASGLGSVSTIGTTNLSDYVAFGFVTSEHKRQISKIEEEIYEPKATANSYISNSAGNEWGGSVNFQSIRARVNRARNMKVGNNQPITSNVIEAYPIRETYVNNTLQGSVTDTVAGPLMNGQALNQKPTYYYSDKNAYGITGENSTIGSYYVFASDNTTGRRLYLCGNSDVSVSSVKSVTRITESDSTEECYYIQGSNGYIGVKNDGTIKDNCAKADDETAIFHYDSTEKCLYTRKMFLISSNPLKEIDTLYFLNVENGNYKIEQTNNTTWTKNANTGTFSGEPKWKFKIYRTSNNNTYYMNYNNTTSVTYGNNANTATVWNISNHGTTNRQSGIYTTQNGSTFYLNYSGNSGGTGSSQNTDLRLYRAQYKWWTRNTDSGTSNVTFKIDDDYLYLNNTTWRLNTSSQNLTLAKDSSTVSGSYETVDDTSYTYTITEERSGQAGYIPLTTAGDGKVSNYNTSTLKNFYTSELNTGYIVGGLYDCYNGGRTFLSGQYFGDARISHYDRQFVKESWTSSGYDTIWTINDDSYNGTGDNATQSQPVTFEPNDSFAQSFTKLSDSLKQLDGILKTDSSYVAGIHFMESAIRTDRTIKADSVMINGEYKTDYEMPEDSIDFHLKENGYINFFAGNYHTDNNSFFALHKIERDSNDNITAIKKIKFVFKDADDPLGDCIYLFDNGNSSYTWSDGETLANRPISKNSFSVDGKNYEFAFDTKWIGKNETLIPHKGSSVNANDTDAQYHRLYYFEIPVNVGEYALGSCDDGCGAYLIYLDISAASQFIERKTLNEIFYIETLTGEIPNGTQYVSSIPQPISVTDPITNEEDKTAIVRPGISDIDDLDSYYGSISSSANGDYTFNRSSNTITVSGTNALTSDYLGDGLTLSGSTSSGRTSRIIRRIIDYDYNTILGTCVKQTTTIEIEGTGNSAHNYATTKLEYNETDFDDPLTTIAIFSYDWIGDGPVFQYSYYLRFSSVQGTNSDVEVYFSNAYNEYFELTVKYVDDDFNFICVGDPTPVTSSDIPANPSESNPYPTREILKTVDTLDDPDKWYDFTKASGGYTQNESTVTPTLIATFRYTIEGTETIDENFIYSGYASLGEPNEYGEKPTVITITNGSYTYEFTLSGSNPVSSQQDPAVTIYYVAQGVYIVRMSNGSEYILFVDESQ